MSKKLRFIFHLLSRKVLVCQCQKQLLTTTILLSKFGFKVNGMANGQKLGEFEGKIFCPRANPAARALARSRAEKLSYHFLILRAPTFFLKERQFFCEAVPRERHGGGAGRMDFFRHFC